MQTLFAGDRHDSGVRQHDVEPPELSYAGVDDFATASVLRTSATSAWMPRPVFSTNLTVSSRSSRLASGYSTQGSSAQISNPMMSAPSSANLTAPPGTPPRRETAAGRLGHASRPKGTDQLSARRSPRRRSPPTPAGLGVARGART
jgi:hypothetical protein